MKGCGAQARGNDRVGSLANGRLCEGPDQPTGTKLSVLTGAGHAFGDWRVGLLGNCD